MTEYQYNALSQLTKILNHTSTGDVLSQHTFSYNPQDLRANEIFDGSAIPPAPAVPDINTTYNTNEVNQLLSTLAPDRAFVYDDDGNMTQGYTKDGYVFTAEYDAQNRMTSLEYTDSGSVLHRQEFRYSGDDLLAEQLLYENSVLVDTVRIVRDGMLAIQDRNASNIVMREYTWGLNLGGGIGGLLNLNSAGQNYAYLYDGKGNVEAVLDNTQAVVAAYRYDPFGKVLNKTGSLNQPYGFSTKRYNAPVGMVQYEYRNYFPAIGRWSTRDPLGEAGGLNLYAFVGNNPVNWVDPWGESYSPSSSYCQDLLQKINNIIKEIEKRQGELKEDPLTLPGKHPNDKIKPSLSRQGHQMLINMHKARLAVLQALYLSNCGGQPPIMQPKPGESFFKKECWKNVVPMVAVGVGGMYAIDQLFQLNNTCYDGTACSVW